VPVPSTPRRSPRLAASARTRRAASSPTPGLGLTASVAGYASGATPITLASCRSMDTSVNEGQQLPAFPAPGGRRLSGSSTAGWRAVLPGGLQTAMLDLHGLNLLTMLLHLATGLTRIS